MVRHSFSSVHSLETVQANVEGQHGGPTGMANIDAKQANTAYEFHENCHSVTFYVMKKDSKRCCDTTNDAVTPQRQSQFTPKMKANAVPHLLSSLV